MVEVVLSVDALRGGVDQRQPPPQGIFAAIEQFESRDRRRVVYRISDPDSILDVVFK